MPAPTNTPRYNRPAPRKTDASAELAAGRLVPRAVDVEAAVLGALMLEKDAFMQVNELLSPESFYEPKHRRVYEAILRLGVAQEPIDLITVTNRMRLDGTLEEVGGPAFVALLSQNVASAAHIDYHAKIVAQKYLARQLISFATRVEEGAFDESNDVDDLLQEAEKNLFDISQRNLKQDVVQIDPVLRMAVEQMQLASQRESGLSGLSTGFTDLDKITSGWQKSDLIIIAARPAMGKTAFVLSMALNIALNDDPVAVFSLEMSKVQLVNRLISNACEVPGNKVRSGSLSSAEFGLMFNRMQRLTGIPFYIDDTSSLSMLELRTKARRLVREHGVKLIIIDYLQLMTAGVQMGSREQEVSTISRNLKQLARELSIPVIALSQLNRKLEDRSNKDKRPQLSDLRESGAIEQDADIVCFIHRPEYYTHGKEDSDGNSQEGLAEFIIAKHRSGATADVKMRFRREYVRFENWTDNSMGDFGTFRPASDNSAPSGAPGATPEPDPQKASDMEAFDINRNPNDGFLNQTGIADVPF